MHGVNTKQCIYYSTNKKSYKGVELGAKHFSTGKRRVLLGKINNHLTHRDLFQELRYISYTLTQTSEGSAAYQCNKAFNSKEQVAPNTYISLQIQKTVIRKLHMESVKVKQLQEAQESKVTNLLHSAFASSIERTQIREKVNFTHQYMCSF